MNNPPAHSQELLDLITQQRVAYMVVPIKSAASLRGVLGDSVRDVATVGSTSIFFLKK